MDEYFPITIFVFATFTVGCLNILPSNVFIGSMLSISCLISVSISILYSMFHYLSSWMTTRFVRLLKNYFVLSNFVVNILITVIYLTIGRCRGLGLYLFYWWSLSMSVASALFFKNEFIVNSFSSLRKWIILSLFSFLLP